MEQDIMAGESDSERSPRDGREESNEFDSAPAQQNGPSPFNDGPELIRDTHC
jgi:hypothetical protein